MRLTEFRKTWIIRQVRKYADQIGIPQNEIPYTILTRKEWLELPKEIIKGKRTITHRIYGTIQSPDYTLMFLNVRKHKNLNEIKKTIIRQLWLCRFSNIQNGKNVTDKNIEQILKGKRFPRKGANTDLTSYN
jgi:hypothetical protein